MLFAAIRAHPLGTLVTAGPAGIVANAIPFTVHGDGVEAVLRAHLARANDQVAELRHGSPALVVFQGPQAYVSPSWYATKQEHGKVVPTWNYVVVQARGTPVVIDDRAWLRAQVDALTAAHEEARPDPWRTGDAPPSFMTKLLGAIVGVEIPIASIGGKWKVSQNQPLANRAGVENGLRSSGATDMADAVAAGLRRV